MPAQRTRYSYDAERRAFTWERARGQMAGLPGGRGLNIGYEAVDRHVDQAEGHRIALRFLTARGAMGDLSYERLRQLSNRFAEVLGDLAVHRGDRVATLLERQPELYIAAFGTLKRGAVFSPLPCSFGPELVRERLRVAEITVLVTTPSIYWQRWRESGPSYPHCDTCSSSPAPPDLPR
jgi:acetyl-CoA synthetase